MFHYLRVSSAVLVLISLSLTAQAKYKMTRVDLGQETVSYYGEDFYQQIQRGAVEDQLKDILKNILRSYHQHIDGQFDTIGNQCLSKDCYTHTSVGYDAARMYLLGEIYLVKMGSNYAVKDVYCQEIYGPERFHKNKPGPRMVPDNDVVNIEHTWPQSRFTHKYPEGTQKSDMHHLFPTDSQMNSIRSSYPFGMVDRDSQNLKCKTVRIGSPSGGGRGTVFQAPPEHRGNVARALFYFALRYDMTIDSDQETALKLWNEEDPVDQDEEERNDRIYALQGNRNPFIDHPALVNLISDF